MSETQKPQEMTEAQKAEQQAERIKNYLEMTDNAAALAALENEIYNRNAAKYRRWPTGFPVLDQKLKGGFKAGQLIFLGAISSLGKTSFALQIAAQVAEVGKDVLIFSLEMSRDELNAKTLSRYMYLAAGSDPHLREYAASTQDILDGNIQGVVMGQATDPAQGTLFVEALERSRNIAKNIRIFVGNNNISVDKVREVVDLHIAATGKRPLVILDYLQILQPSEYAKTTDKRLLTDYDTTTLKVIARYYEIPIMVISAFNRTNYLEPVSMGSFRESSSIEYSSDILLGLQYQGMEYQKIIYTDDKGNRRKGYEGQKDHDSRVREMLDQMDMDGANGLPLPIELKLLKNRNGVKGTVRYSFLPAHNLYTETGLTMVLDESKPPMSDDESPSVVSRSADTPSKKPAKSSKKQRKKGDVTGTVWES